MVPGPLLKKYQWFQITHRLKSELSLAFKTPASPSIMMSYCSSDAAFSVDTIDGTVLLLGKTRALKMTLLASSPLWGLPRLSARIS